MCDTCGLKISVATIGNESPWNYVNNPLEYKEKYKNVRVETLTVGKLIELLKKYPLDAPVILCCDDAEWGIAGLSDYDDKEDYLEWEDKKAVGIYAYAHPGETQREICFGVASAK